MAVTFGEWLRAQRTDKGLSQERLAEAVGVDRAYVNKIERGRIGLPEEASRERFHKVLGTNEDDLLELGIIQRHALAGMAAGYSRLTGQLVTVTAGDSGDPLTDAELDELRNVVFTGLNDLSPKQLRDIVSPAHLCAFSLTR